MKKFLILLLSLTLSQALILSAYADSINVDSLLKLKKSVIMENNTNNNIVDIINLKHDILYNNQEVKNYSATTENVKILSRYSILDNITWLNQSGSAIEFQFTGTSLDITINADTSYGIENPPRYAILFNDTLVTDELISAKEKVINVINSNTEVSGIVKVIKLSEAANGSIGIGNIAIKSNSNTPIVPVAKKSLTIEFIGDSITCAYGVEANNEYEHFSTSTENFMKSYAYLTAKKLNADYSTLCYSGHGIISGYTTDEKNTALLVPPYYDGVSKQWDYKDIKWNFEDNPVDIVLINLGTNDDSYLKFDYENRSSEFISSYVDFLKVVREKNPNAKIICTMGLMGGHDTFNYIQKAILEYTSQTGDSNISSFKLTMQNFNNGLGADWHPSAKSQELCSDEVVKNIQEIMNS